MGVLHTGTIWVSGLLKEENKIPQIKNMARATLPHFKNMRSATPQPRNLIDVCSLYTLTQLNICTNCIVMKITFARDCICEAPMPTYKQEVSSWATHLARTHPVLASPQLVHFNILIPADNRLPRLRSLELLFSQHVTDERFELGFKLCTPVKLDVHRVYMRARVYVCACYIYMSPPYMYEPAQYI